jgi:hypothetical protein
MASRRPIAKSRKLEEFIPDWLEPYLESDPSDVMGPIGMVEKGGGGLLARLAEALKKRLPSKALEAAPTPTPDKVLREHLDLPPEFTPVGSEPPYTRPVFKDPTDLGYEAVKSGTPQRRQLFSGRKLDPPPSDTVPDPEALKILEEFLKNKKGLE